MAYSVPVAMVIGGIASASNFVVQILVPVLCSAGTAAGSYYYTTTTTDENGNSQPSTAAELHWVDNDGTVVKEDPVPYACLWTGIVTAVGRGITALLAFTLAATGGVLIAPLLDRDKKTDITKTSNQMNLL